MKVKHRSSSPVTFMLTVLAAATLAFVVTLGVLSYAAASLS